MAITQDFEDDIKNSVKCILDGGVLLYPTDTIWGLGCNAMNENAVDKIFNIKNRPAQKSMIVLLAEAKDILQYIAAPHPDIISILESFDRPTTVIYDHPLGFPENVVATDDTLAIRVTNDPFCKALIKRMKLPLISTSANLSGEPSPKFFSEIDTRIKDNVDYVVRYRQDDTTNVPPSRILKINDEGDIHIIRE
ncbi:MAG: threonylcarbamoyl-AMP synthase [Chitinophagales bacterium]|nr:threonylcarbamoyl-AMP synthase [Chitinophagaceae bacterium]MCB9063684.1 threonylcarbamoyl-AMP synthase [Chitinophagales bacterium]